MRINDDFLYGEWKERIEDAFHMFEWDSFSPEECVGYIVDEANENGDGIYGTSTFLFILAVTTRELELDVLEEQILYNAAYHIYRYENMGKYKDDLTQEEIEDIERDIAFVKSKVELPELESYELNIP